MKRIIILLSIFIISPLILKGVSFAQLSTIDHTSPSITQDLNKVVDTNSIQDPLRQGSHFAIQSPNSKRFINTVTLNQIRHFDDAENSVLHIIRTILNVLLGFVSLITLILLIYEGYKVVVYSASNNDQYKKALGRLKTYALAIAGIAVSRLIVTFIFYVLNLVTTP